MKIDAETLDRITVRYAVSLTFAMNEGTRDFYVATAEIPISCGVYDGVPTRAMLAALVGSRSIQADDLDVTGGPKDRQAVADAINARGVLTRDVQAIRIEEVMVDEETVAETLLGPEPVDLWDDAGPFLYRMLPETGLDAFFHEERETIRISAALGKWWLGQDGRMGQDSFDTIEAAKAAGDKEVAELEAALDGMLLKEAGLDASAWRVDYSDGIAFHEIAGDRWIVGDVRDGMADRQRWDARRGDDIVSEGHATVAAALAAFGG